MCLGFEMSFDFDWEWRGGIEILCLELNFDEGMDWELLIGRGVNSLDSDWLSGLLLSLG